MSTQKTDYIILRKTPYHKTSLILAGISKEYGRVDLLVKGAKKIGSKSLPAIDLFREINVGIDIRKSGLQTVYSAELVSNFDSIALKKEAYIDACEISRFILRNSHFLIPSPNTYKSVKSAFRALSSGEYRYSSPLVKLVFLEENGLLPELPQQKDKERKLLSALIGAAKGDSEIPAISHSYLQEIYEWLESLCKFNEL